jgi:hypothetical protein
MLSSVWQQNPSQSGFLILFPHSTACVCNGFEHRISNGRFNADLLPVVHPYCAGRARRHPGARADVEPVVLALPAGVGLHGIPVHQWSWALCLPPYLCGSTVAGIGGNSISHPFRWRGPLMNRTLGLSSPHSSGPVYHAFLRYEAILRCRGCRSHATTRPRLLQISVTGRTFRIIRHENSPSLHGTGCERLRVSRLAAGAGNCAARAVGAA